MDRVRAGSAGGAVPMEAQPASQPVDFGKTDKIQHPDLSKAKELEKRVEKGPVNIGAEVIAGYKGMENGREVRKDPPEDVKINDPDHGLFAVLDGVSGEQTGGGAKASVLTARIIQERLGEQFDQGIANILRSTKIPDNEREAKIRVYYEAAMKNAVKQAHNALKDIPDAVTTLSLSKIIPMPNGERKMVMANIGDSRIYRSRDGKLEKLTRDDGILGQVEKTDPAMAARIDQAKNPAALPKAERDIFNARNRLWDGIGHREPQSKSFDVPLEVIDIAPGDRFLISSDGVHDNLINEEIAQMLEAPDAKRAEYLLQTACDDMAQDKVNSRKLNQKPKKPRSKSDDISAVVFDIPAEWPELPGQEAEPAKTQAEIIPFYPPERLKQMREQVERMSRDIFRKQQEIQRIESPRPGEVPNPIVEMRLAIELKQLEEKQARIERELAQYSYRKITQDIPHRLQEGNSVRLYKDKRLREPDPKRYTVARINESDSYLLQADQSTVNAANTGFRTVDRFELEYQQWKNEGEAPVRKGDMLEGGYRVTGARMEQGEQVLIAEKNGEVQEFSKDQVRKMVFDKLSEGYRLRQEIASLDKEIALQIQQREQYEKDLADLENPEPAPTAEIAMPRVEAPPMIRRQDIEKHMLTQIVERPKQKKQSAFSRLAERLQGKG